MTGSDSTPESGNGTVGLSVRYTKAGVYEIHLGIESCILTAPTISCLKGSRGYLNPPSQQFVLVQLCDLAKKCLGLTFSCKFTTQWSSRYPTIVLKTLQNLETSWTSQSHTPIRSESPGASR